MDAAIGDNNDLELPGCCVDVAKGDNNVPGCCVEVAKGDNSDLELPAIGDPGMNS